MTVEKGNKTEKKPKSNPQKNNIRSANEMRNSFNWAEWWKTLMSYKKKDRGIDDISTSMPRNG